MRKINDRLLRWYIAVKNNQKGATAVEYGLIVALIAAVIVAVVALLGTEINAAFQTVLDEIQGA